MRHEGLDTAHNGSSPHLSWDAMPRRTNCTLDLISDPDMFSKVEAGIRGWVSMISTRHARPNNRYMTAYDAARNPSYIIYLDANNLYGWDMSQKFRSVGSGG